MTDAELMKAARAAFQWTQAEAAQALGITVPQVSNIENGRSRLTKTLAILLGAYRDKPWGWRPPFQPWKGPS